MEFFSSLFYSENMKCSSLKRKEKLKFFIHDDEYTVNPDEYHPSTSLNKYLRDVAHLTGTKNMCLEGGCGACVVAVSFMDPVTQKRTVMAVNSCLVPIYMCSGWKIYTVDGIGDPGRGYHPIQKAMVKFSGTQCGYCSSGMIMNMYALYENGENFTMEDVDNSFGGNICRCTGYRPILTAFKSLSSNASDAVIGSHCDIEDIPVCKRDKKLCQKACSKKCHEIDESHFYTARTAKWFKVNSINEILDVLKSSPGMSHMLVGGNTATGVYKSKDDTDVYIDITNVKTLLDHTIENNELVLGANMTLTNAMELFRDLSDKSTEFSYLKTLADHIDLIANVPVRNTGTLAGNLFTKHKYKEFPSDIFLIFETVGATLTIVDIDHHEVVKGLEEFLDYDMTKKVIQNVRLPPLDDSYRLETYKIMPRAQNAHAIVNAGFLLKLDEKDEVESARIVYGSINPDFVHASNTESYIMNKKLFDDETLQGAFAALNGELDPDYVLPDPSPQFRKDLAIALFYKFILKIAPENKISPRNKSGGVKQKRAVSSGTQDFETNESLYPLTQPIAKIEALAQCSGKAEYIMDMPDRPDQLYAAFVLTEAPANSIIKKVDPSEALKLDGVKAYYDKSDVPGANNFMPKEAGFFSHFTEEVFVGNDVVKYYNQPVGIVVATSREIAERAAELVEIAYERPSKKQHFTIKDILANNVSDKIREGPKHEAKKKGTDVKHVIKGSFNIGNQYHYQMETQCCVVIPTEDGLDMFPSTQDMTMSQISAAKFLNIPANKVNVTVRRLGGAYGSKITRNGLVSCATALAAHKLQKPVKMAMSFPTNMKVVGKRHPFYAIYEVGVDDEGVIQYLDNSIYSDLGAMGGNENVTSVIMEILTGTYKNDTWTINSFAALTDTPTNTWTRAPATNEGYSCCENIMQHIAVSLKLDPLQVRLKNLQPEHARVLQRHIDDMMTWAEVDKRKTEIVQFNSDNRWVKRGIAIVPMHYPMELFGNWKVTVTIYQADGSVAILHGGVEMGQGLNTKVAQVCAHALGIPLDQILIRPSTTINSPNGYPTGGSLTSEAVSWATLQACEVLKKRMDPIREKMTNPTWTELVQKSHQSGIDLNTSYSFDPSQRHKYPIYGVTCADVEVDLLTGLTQVKRVDIIEDTGNSMSPLVDIGQVEGAFVMGMGYWTSEQIVVNSEGALMTTRTWNYKPPGAKDIPVDFRVKFPKNNPNPLGVLNSKAVAEPPLLMSFSLPLAIRDAVAYARLEADSSAEKWYGVDGPSSVENTFTNSLNNYKQYVL